MTSYIDRVFKHVAHAFSSGEEIVNASKLWPTPLYYTGAVKLMSTVTEKLLLEGGFGASVNDISMIYQPGIRKVRGTPEWFSTASRQDITLSTRTVAGTAENFTYPPVYQFAGSASYVTGSNTLRGGAQWRYGPYRVNTNVNADLIQRYRNSVPDSVIVYNTPQHSREQLNADLGVWAQDSWTLKRLTLNPGRALRILQRLDQRDGGRGRPFRRLPLVSAAGRIFRAGSTSRRVWAWSTT